MQDNPPVALLVAEARLALDAGLATGFPQKVAANALGIAQRELELGPSLAEAERARLADLLARNGDLPELNAALAHALRDGRFDTSEDDLLGHLILTTIAKLSVDQPSYPGFRALSRP